MNLDADRTPMPQRESFVVVSNRYGRETLAAGFAFAAFLGGCASESTPRDSERELWRADASRGELFIRPDHNIGGYDQTYFAPIVISNLSGRDGLGERELAALSESLDKSLRARAEKGEVAVASEPAPCAMKMVFSIKDIEIDALMSQIQSGSNTTFITSMGAVTLEVYIRDSLTNTPLLRFTERRRLPGGEIGGSGRGELFSALEKTLDILLADFAIRLREVVPQSSHQDAVAPGCRSTIRKLIESANQPR